MSAVLIFAILFGLAASQRSPYVPSGGTYPKMLPRYRTTTTTTTPNPNDLGNRNGEESTSTSEVSNVNKPSLQFGNTLQTEDFYNRVASWPEERQPFWFKNRFAMQTHREKEIVNPTDEQTFGTRFGQRPQSFFAGNSRPRSQAVRDTVSDEDEDSDEIPVEPRNSKRSWRRSYQ